MVKLFRLRWITVHTMVADKIEDLLLGFEGVVGEQQRNAYRLYDRAWLLRQGDARRRDRRSRPRLPPGDHR